MRPCLFLTAAILATTLASCGSCSRGPGDAIRFQIPSEPVTLDPALAEDGISLRILANTMDGLLGYDAKGNLEPRLASDFAVSESGKTVLLNLRPGIRWSDGRPVEGADFVRGFRRVLAPGSGSKLADLLFSIQGAREVSSGRADVGSLAVFAEGNTVRIQLAEPAPYFPHALTLPVAMPERDETVKDPIHAPVTGAYRIESREKDQVIHLVPNPKYWRADAEGKSRVPVDLVVVKEDSTALNLFDEGKLDVASRIPNEEIARLDRQGKIAKFPFFATYFIGFNTRKGAFASREARLAAARAIDADAVVQVIGSVDSPARGWIPFGLEGSIDPSKAPPRAPAKPRSTGGGKPATEAEFVLGFDAGSRNATIAEKIQADLRERLAIRLKLEPSDWKTHISRIRSDPPALFRFGWQAPFMDPLSHLMMLTSGSPNNFTGWSSQEYDRLVGRIVAARPGAPERAQLIREAEAILAAEMPIVPIYHYSLLHAVSPRVGGFASNPIGVVQFRDLSLAR